MVSKLSQGSFYRLGLTFRIGPLDLPHGSVLPKRQRAPKLTTNGWTRFKSPLAASPHSGARWIRGWWACTCACTCMSGQGCITGLRRIMHPTQSGELLSSHQCSDARMRRPTRPFTVEIKSSRRPASIRKPAPALVDPPRAEPLFQDVLLRDTWKVGQDRRPAREAALSEADQVFRRLAVSAPSPVQAAGLHAVAQQGPEVEVVAPDQPRAARLGAEPRQARILPDLLSLSRAGAPLSPETEKRSDPHSPKVQERVEPEAAEMSPSFNQTAPLDAGHDHCEPAEMETL